MNIYLAPLEGIRDGFLAPYKKCFEGLTSILFRLLSRIKWDVSARGRKDILPEHNKGMHAVPQILTNFAEDFVQTAKEAGTVRV